MPEPLSVCFFVNSGSEANDLALRLAEAHTKNKDLIVVDHAYHGHTVAVIDISPYKYEKYKKKGGPGQQPWVHKVPCPDTYRGQHRGPEAATQYAQDVADACTAAGGKVAAFFIESGMSVAGVIMPPQGYLQQCYQHVRAAGGVCVADEVQTGFGRFGSSFWGFEQQDVVPDIVTMGKPFGNGMPLAAVVTTPAVAESFYRIGVEYFNTFGGNPVVCAAGLAVLDVIEQEKLQEHALHVGQHLKDRLKALSQTTAGQLIGDMRGSGLFLGVEFVRNRQSLQPATAETSVICTRLKDEFSILTSIDGPHDNVLVIKPPMCFGVQDADKLVDSMSSILNSLGVVDLNASHTPT